MLAAAAPAFVFALFRSGCSFNHYWRTSTDAAGQGINGSDLELGDIQQTNHILQTSDITNTSSSDEASDRKVPSQASPRLSNVANMNAQTCISRYTSGDPAGRAHCSIEYARLDVGQS